MPEPDDDLAFARQMFSREELQPDREPTPARPGHVPAEGTNPPPHATDEQFVIREQSAP